MGVHGLWPLLHPVARPVALETMGGKKLAIDSSIWLYQFQIAMRDKEGRALDNAHILGFLRRICKLLFYGIKPVFVFDGGAPTIKKVAISNRKNRKQGAKESAARTAEKLLAAQLRAAAIKQARKDAAARQAANGDGAIPPPGTNGEEGALRYMDDDFGIIPRGAPQPRPRAANANSSSSPARGAAGSPAGAAAQSEGLEDLVPKKKKYVHKDQYALPVIEGPISSRGAPSDPRLATEAELRSFIEDMRPEDFDMDSEFFQNLPVEAKYEIIGDLRIKSRQRNSKRVEAMKNAPTPLDFSRAQIMGLAHRNELTQKLLTMTDSLSRVMPMSGPVRIAGERNKEYVLIKNDTSKGTGYILGVRGGGETASTPVKIEGSTTEDSDLDKTSTDEEFEQVQIPSNGITRVKSPSPEILERRREMAKEAIRQRYSPVKPRRGDSPVDDLPELPPQRPLFVDENVPSTSVPTNDGAEQVLPFVIPEDIAIWDQISTAVAQADSHGGRLSKDEEEDLQRAIEASKRDVMPQKGLNGNGQSQASTEDSGDESDVSFDEVETSNVQADKAASPVKQAPPQKKSAPVEVEDSDDDSVEYVRVDEPIQAQMNAQPQPARVIQSVPQAASAKMPSSQSSDHKTAPIPSQNQASDNAVKPASAQESEQHTLQNRKPPGLTLDIPPAAYRPPSPEEKQVRTPRPDLTEEQTRRDISPQLVAEHDGIVERDYAPQPSQSPDSPATKEQTTRAKQTNVTEGAKGQSKSEDVIVPVATLNVPPRPSLMARTLSNQSQAKADGEGESEPARGKQVAQSQQHDKPLSLTISKADEQALTGGSLSILDEVKGAMPNEEKGVDKGDLQEGIEDGDVASLAHAKKAEQVPEEGKRAQNGKEKEDGRDSSPEVVYEWSPSPEPAPRPKPSDPSLLAPDDPNYIPPDIDFPEPGHELSDLDEDDREHLQSLTSEQVEYAKFLAELKSRNLEDMEQEVETELSGLKEQDKRDKKMADDITVQMAKDIQLLLKVLGLPYVIAPMEAEAQCAELLSRALVDGVITDDNDVFLFGATKVYKNMFNQNKYVECYLATDIERELALDRHRLIRLAHFLGSDYCDGLPGVGPVLGMELMAEFPGPNGLIEFRDWWLKVQRGRDTPADHPTAFRRKFKKSKKDLYIDESWPSPEVARAYLHPSVDESDQPFMWGIPDLDALREYLHNNLGWGQTKTDELMLPIIRKMTGRAAGGAVNQSTISNFFDVSGGTGRFAPMSNRGYQSKRLQAVVKAWRQSQQRLAKEEGSDEDDDAMLDNSEDDGEEAAQTGKRRATRPSASRKNSRGSSRPSSSRRSSGRKSSQAASDDEEERAFNEALEAKLAKMGVKRKRETPVGSTRVIKPAKRSKRGGGKLAARARQNSTSSSQTTGKKPLFAEGSGSEEDEDDGSSQSQSQSRSQSQLQSKSQSQSQTQSQPQSKKKATRPARKAVLADSDEYEE